RERLELGRDSDGLLLDQEFGSSNVQSVLLYAHGQDAKSLLAARRDAEQSVVQPLEVFYPRGRADRNGFGGSDFPALDDQSDAEGHILAHAAPDHIDIARFEDAQPKRTSRKQHRVQWKERELHDVHWTCGRVVEWTCGRVDVSVRGPPSDVYTSTRLLVIRTLPQSREQLLVDAAETAVRHDQHVIPGSRRLDKRRDETVDIRRNLRARSERRDAFRHIPLNARPLVHEDLIGARERSRERFPVRAEFHRVRARLEYRDQ